MASPQESSPPPTAAHSRASSVSPYSSESSIIDELSFDYGYDEEGNFVRNSKGSTSRTSPRSSLSTPPKDSTGIDSSELPAKPLQPSPSLRRASLSRSESAYPVLNGPSSERDRAQPHSANPARSFLRTASGPIPTSTTESTGPPIRNLPRRIDQSILEARQKRNTEELRARLASIEQEEKENIRDISAVDSSRSASSVSSRALPSRSAYGSQSLGNVARPLLDIPQRVLSSSSRMVLKGTGSTKPPIDRISEVVSATESDDGDDVYAYGRGPSVNTDGPDTDLEDDDAAPPPYNIASRPQYIHQPPHSAGIQQSSNESGATRPRRSASLSDALYYDDEHHVPSQTAQVSQRQVSRPGTSLGLRREVPVIPPRRVGDERHDDNRNPQENGRDDYQLRTRHTPSPTNNAQLPARTAHKRRDSDTLRGYPASVTLVDPPRLSPTVKGLSSVPSRTPNDKVTAGNMPAKHRRSPTAPDPSTGSNSLQAGIHDSNLKDREREAQRERGRSQQCQSAPSQLPQANGPAPPPPNQSAQGYPTSSSFVRHVLVHSDKTQSDRRLINEIQVNKKVYARLDLIGRGGSSRVYRVMTFANELFAVKKVALDKTDSETMAGYMNEIALLKRLEGNSRIIRLVDSEVRPGPGGSKGHLLLVMECGEIDLARLISERNSEGLDMVWVAYYWQQMLQAVQVIHDEKIVHSDLKPGNFVLVKGQLKLIDFGIANAIANDTTNIQRDHQIGTLNYMSPEAIELPDGMRRLKVGRSSDVWSLGCILYQMVYGSTPFSQLTIYQKMKAIPDTGYGIPFPEYSVPVIPASKASPGEPRRLEHLRRKVRADVIANMRSCLNRTPKDRMTIPELLQEGWLAMKETPAPEPEPAPTLKDLVAPDEAVINAFYMGQLLKYGMQLGQSGHTLDDAALDAKAVELIKELRAVQEKS